MYCFLEKKVQDIIPELVKNSSITREVNKGRYGEIVSLNFPQMNSQNELFAVNLEHICKYTKEIKDDKDLIFMKDVAEGFLGFESESVLIDKRSELTKDPKKLTSMLTSLEDLGVGYIWFWRNTLPNGNDVYTPVKAFSDYIGSRKNPLFKENSDYLF